MELLEYFDKENKNSLGIAERDYIHSNNLWHREVSIWILNEKNEFLFQRRSSKKKRGANKLSITAGHVDVHEKEIMAALREIKEEIGLEFKEEDLNFVGVFKSEHEGNMCFSYTYLVRTNKKIADMIMNEDEVSELKYMTIEELDKKIATQDEEMPLLKKPSVISALEKIKKEFVEV